VPIAVGSLSAQLFATILGIAKVAFDNINRLKPLGYVLGKDGDGEG